MSGDTEEHERYWKGKEKDERKGGDTHVIRKGLDARVVVVKVVNSRSGVEAGVASVGPSGRP